MADTPSREALRQLLMRVRGGSIDAETDILEMFAARPADDGVQCALENQIEIMSAVSLLLRYAQPDLIGKSGELDRQRDDLFQRYKATHAALSPGEQNP